MPCVAGTIIPPPGPSLSSSTSISDKIALITKSITRLDANTNIYHTPGMICPVDA